MTKLLQRYEPILFDYNALQRMPNVCPGVYVFWSISTSRCVYVGKTDRSVDRRLFEHFKGSHNPYLRTWIKRWPTDLQVCYAFVPKRYVNRFEVRLIKLLDPLANDKNKP